MWEYGQALGVGFGACLVGRACPEATCPSSGPWGATCKSWGRGGSWSGNEECRRGREMPVNEEREGWVEGERGGETPNPSTSSCSRVSVGSGEVVKRSHWYAYLELGSGHGALRDDDNVLMPRRRHHHHMLARSHRVGHRDNHQLHRVLLWHLLGPDALGVGNVGLLGIPTRHLHRLPTNR